MAADVEVDWFSYFESIKTECPWSRRAWANSLIDIESWGKPVTDLQQYQARIWIYPTKPRLLKKTTEKLNSQRLHELWLWSHPKYKQYSTPVAVLIQQDRNHLETIRKNLNLNSLDK